MEWALWPICCTRLHISQERMIMKNNVLIVQVAPIERTPPLRNCAAHFARRGAKVIVIGYKNKNSSKYERLGRNQWIIRLDLRSRKIRIKAIAQIFALIEFLYAIRKIMRRISPGTFVAFNDLACLCFAVCIPQRYTTRIAWLLEFYHGETKGIYNKISMAVTSRFWRRADALVVPTRERLALHLCFRPECLIKKHFVIQNAPNMDDQTLPEAKEVIDVPFLSRSVPARLRIVYSGGIKPGHGLENLIKAAGLMSEDIELYILGKRFKTEETDSYTKDFQKQIDWHIGESNKRGNIKWLDFVPYTELQRIIRLMDVGYITYEPNTLNTYFSAPGKLYEYLKAGLVVLTDHKSCLKRELAAAGCMEFFSRDVSGKLRRLGGGR